MDRVKYEKIKENINELVIINQFKGTPYNVLSYACLNADILIEQLPLVDFCSLLTYTINLIDNT